MGFEFEPLSEKIIEAALCVHRELGPGFLEAVYESAMRVALVHRGITFQAQREVTVFFEQEEVGLHKLSIWSSRIRSSWN